MVVWTLGLVGIGFLIHHKLFKMMILLPQSESLECSSSVSARWVRNHYQTSLIPTLYKGLAWL